MEKIPFIQLDFNQNQYIFEEPIDIIKTNKLSQVKTQFEKVEQAVNHGYYVTGFLTYEASPAFNEEYETKSPNQMPLLWFGVFNEPKQKTIEKKFKQEQLNWRLNITKKEFFNTFKKIKRNIQNNELEQINLTTRYETKFSGHPYTYYLNLLKAQQADYSAYIQTEDFCVLSLSPELFFEINDGTIVTKPMKGTIERGLTYEEDLKKKEWLENSKKNIYENQLATDLMCRELEQITKQRSLKIYDQFKVKRYPTLYQMTSTIKGTLKNKITLEEIFKTLFPSTSITGTPKEVAMEQIKQFEQSPRHIYCGTIGLMTPERNALFNVPIRTVLIDKNKEKAIYGVGGAITKDSTAQEEFNEIKTKAKILHRTQNDFQLIETIGLIDGTYIVLNEHLTRLKQSTKYFNFQINITNIKRTLLKMQKKYKKGNWRIRLLIEASGNYKVEVNEFEKITKKMPVTLAKQPLQKNNPFLYHKTTNRSIYEELKIKDDDYFDTLLWNENEEITEFTIGNVVVKLNGKLYTPPVSSGLLPGTFRKKLLTENIINERPITIHELNDCEQIFFINSVRKWIEVTLQ